MNGAGEIASSIGDILIIGLFMTPVFIAVFLILMFKQYRNKIVLRIKTKGDTDKIIQTGFRILKLKGEPEQIKTLKRRLKLPIPPDEAVDILENGAIFCEGYLTETGEVTWINIDSKKEIIETIKEHNIEKAGQVVKIKEKGQKSVISEIHLTKLSSQDKAFYFNRLRIAEQKYALGGFWEFMNKNAGLIVCLIAMFGLFLFWGDVMKPGIDAAHVIGETRKTELEIVNRLDILINDRQIIRDAPDLNLTSPAPEAPE